MIVPFERFEALLIFYEPELGAGTSTPPSGGTSPTGTCIRTSSRDRLPTSNPGAAAILAFGREAIRLGGAPLAEHGVGRNPTKQKLLTRALRRRRHRRDARGQGARSIPSGSSRPV